MIDRGHAWVSYNFQQAQGKNRGYVFYLIFYSMQNEYSGTFTLGHPQ